MMTYLGSRRLADSQRIFMFFFFSECVYWNAYLNAKKYRFIYNNKYTL